MASEFAKLLACMLTVTTHFFIIIILTDTVKDVYP